jgi:hypothetical protein
MKGSELKHKAKSRLALDELVMEEGNRVLRGQLDKMLVPDPADLVRRVILILGEPKFPFFANDVKDLHDSN